MLRRLDYLWKRLQCWLFHTAPKKFIRHEWRYPYLRALYRCPECGQRWLGEQWKP